LSERRRINGKPLLVASAGLIVAIGGCNRKPPGNLMAPPGNLMAPPAVQVCFDIEPPDAKIVINGAEFADESCTQGYEGASLEITANHDGYAPYQSTYNVQGAPGEAVTHKIQLQKIESK
jgi:hypothetical protein